MTVAGVALEPAAHIRGVDNRESGRWLQRYAPRDDCGSAGVDVSEACQPHHRPIAPDD